MISATPSEPDFDGELVSSVGGGIDPDSPRTSGVALFPDRPDSSATQRTETQKPLGHVQVVGWTGSEKEWGGVETPATEIVSFEDAKEAQTPAVERSTIEAGR